MRACVIALAAFALAAPGAVPAFAADSPMKVCAAQWQAMKKAGTAKGSYTDFSKDCLSKAKAAPAAAASAAAPKSAMAAKKPAAATPAAPAPAAAPAPVTVAKAEKAPKSKTPTVKASDTDPTGATAQCKDGTYSHSKTHSGSCAGHKGVAKFLT